MKLLAESRTWFCKLFEFYSVASRNTLGFSARVNGVLRHATLSRNKRIAQIWRDFSAKSKVATEIKMARSNDFPGQQKPVSGIRGLRQPDAPPEPNLQLSVSEMLANQPGGLLSTGGTKPVEKSSLSVDYLAHNEEPTFGELAAIDVDRIRVSRYQPRIIFSESSIEELATSIQTVGLVKPVLVRPCDDGWFELVGGERRWRAHKLLGKLKIISHVRHLTDAMAMVLALTDNEGQEPLTEYERGRAYKKILDSGDEPSMRALSRRLGVNVSIVSRCLLLMELPAPILEILDEHPTLVGGTAAKPFVEFSKVEPELTKRAVLLIRDEKNSQEQALRWIAKEIAVRNSASVPSRLVDKKVVGYGVLRVDGKKLEFRCEKNIDAKLLSAKFEEFLQTLDLPSLTGG
ncbi:ParB/RepB/Spo0J family partition protein [Pseudomonas sp. AB12(2023)]|uniref:ParB/RepB/Spo0J family partition protein n=1 Tax=Pseudomonas sp. AB12(2023) TaxID=3048597 RepID=UPI002B232C5C|nr:ParB/RepB/Spo0J family partition protein [Pseudomonas sp. AB12(2023)]MEB0222060.1 ParB/RepB/Spo0J family partition protein [Pseudomonas sp. AB12(2023)]